MGLKHIRDAVTGTTLTLFEAIAFLVIFSPCSTLAGLTTVAAAAYSNGSTYTERDLGLGALAGFIVAAIPCALGVIARLLLGEKLGKVFNILIMPFCLIGVGPLVTAVISLLTIGEAPKALLGASTLTAFLAGFIFICVAVIFLPLLVCQATGKALASLLTACGTMAILGVVFAALSKHWGWYVCSNDLAAIAGAVYGVVSVGYSFFLYLLYYLCCIPWGVYVAAKDDRV